MKFVTMLEPNFAGFGAEVRGHRFYSKERTLSSSRFKCNKCTKNCKCGVLCVILIPCNSYLGSLSGYLISWEEEGRLLVAKKRDSNQFENLELPAVTPGSMWSYCRAAEITVNQSSGLEAHSRNLDFSTGGELLHSNGYKGFFLMWSTCLCHEPAYISMPKQYSNLSPCIASQMRYLTLNFPSLSWVVLCFWQWTESLFVTYQCAFYYSGCVSCGCSDCGVGTEICTQTRFVFSVWI